MLVGQTAQVSYDFNTLLWRPTWLTVGNVKSAATTNEFSLLLANAGDSISLELASRVQSIDFVGPGIKTDGDADFALTATATSGLAVAYTSKTPAVCSVNGVNLSILSVGECQIEASQRDSVNYNPAVNVIKSIVVGPKTITVMGANADKVYDGNTTATITGATLQGIVATDDVTLILGSASFVDRNAGTGKVITVTSATLGGTMASNYSLTPFTGLTANISKKTLSVTGATATNKTYNRTTEATVTGATLVGKLGSDVVNLTVGTATFDNKNVGTGKTVTVTGSTLNGGSAGNYTLTEISGLTADITKKTNSISGTIALNQEYDGTTSATISGSVLNGKEGADDITLSTGPATFDNKNNGLNKTVTVTGSTITGSDAGNYILTEISGLTANISKKTLTVSNTVAASKVYDGSTTATLSGSTLVGIVGSEDVTLILGTANFDNINASTGKAVTVTGSGLGGSDAGNYTLGAITGVTADITKATFVITNANPGTKLIAEGTSLTQTFTAGPAVAYNNTITYTSLTPSVCTYNGINTLTLVGAGICTIQATLSIDANYTSGTATQSFGIDRLIDVRDQQIYKVAKIGTQVWMAQNLNVGTRINGMLATANQENNLVLEKYCYGDLESNCTTLGGLYQWAEALALPFSCNATACASSINTVHQGVCPSGWHFPKDAEWNTLTNYLSAATAGTQMKSDLEWIAKPGTSTSKFAALPAGLRNNSGGYVSRTYSANYWQAGELSYDPPFGINRSMYFDSDILQKSDATKEYGYPVRCLLN
jgi:uncharacterized protein (TIGR02145 family)